VTEPFYTCVGAKAGFQKEFDAVVVLLSPFINLIDTSSPP